jgi:hypothetical protein
MVCRALKPKKGGEKDGGASEAPGQPALSYA